MKQDFMLAKETLNQIGIRQVCADFYMEPKVKSYRAFVKSPVSSDKHWSLCLFPNNRYCDFANCNHSGDIIGFISYIKGLNNWEALQILKDFYGLSDAREQDKQEAKRRIQLQQEQERKRKERQQAFYRALWSEIDRLQSWANIYRTAIEKSLYEPFSDMWAYCVEELQKVDYWLDILCAADCKAYPRLKAFHENLPSDHYQWLLDVLGVLQEQGAFEATAGELEELTAQRNFELTRQPGAVRRCSIEW